MHKQEYRQRLDALAKQLEPNSLVVLCSAALQQRSNDTHYPFRQDSNFYYLSGLQEDNSALVLVKKKKKYKVFLFVAPKDPQKELWDGKRLGVKRVEKEYVCDKAYSNTELEAVIKKHLPSSKVVYHSFKRVNKFEKLLKTVTTHKDIDPLIQQLRLIKSDKEIKTIQKALFVTAQAHLHAMQLPKVGLYEYQLQAEFEYIFKKNGAYSDAYTTIVAGGDNANTLHYIKNDQVLRDGELVLIDAGCEYNYYASDITRTIPINGVFSKEQKELYSLVLEVQKAIIAMIQPGVLRSNLQKKAQKLLAKGLIELGILEGSVKKVLQSKQIQKYYPHGIGHYMGLDVHDPCPYKDEDGKEIPLQEGMILTIEPGIYLPKEDSTIPKRYRGIGIRIEDDILVTKKGYKNLSSAIPKEIAEIEALYKA